MGIGRREFLQAFGALIAAVTVEPSAAVCVSDDIYLNRKLGLGFTKPHDWRFLDVQEMGQLDTDRIFDLDDEELLKSLRESAEHPFVIAAGSSPSPEIQAPCIQIYLASHPDEQTAEDRLVSQLLSEAFGTGTQQAALPKFTAPMRKIRHDWQAYRYLSRQFRVSELPEDTTLSNCAAATYVASCPFKMTEENSPLIRIRTIAVENNNLFYLIRLIDSKENPYDFTSIQASIKLI